jgi:hypothetical protein
MCEDAVMVRGEKKEEEKRGKQQFPKGKSTR